MTNLTIQHVRDIMPNAPEGDIEEEFSFLLNVLIKYEINTKLRVAAFLANVAKESGELVYVEEIADGWAYEGRADLGNTEPGDGPKYKGHGYIQITGRHNHKIVGDALGIDCIDYPDTLTEPKYAWLSAGWYWVHGSSWGDLNAFADNSDFESTVMGVRGGPDADRWRYWARALEVLPEDLSVKLPEEPVEPVEPVKPVDNGNIIVDGWTAREIAITDQGWAIDKHTNAYIVMPANNTLKAGSDRWAYKPEVVKPVEPVKPKKFVWPVANTAPNPNSAWYTERHPTRYNFRSDVEEWAIYLISNYSVWCNTYYEHPEGIFPVRDRDSLDVWAAAGRGYGIDYNVGQVVHDLLFNYEGKPDIDWIIWQGWMWSYYGGWEWFSNDKSDADMGHFKHIHVTYF